MAETVLRELAELLAALGHGQTAAEAASLAGEIADGLASHATVDHPRYGTIHAYEVDGFGGCYLMDDANVPSLLALPYLGCCKKDDPLYLRTRSFILSLDNPHFYKGQCASGVGSPHTGLETIWPIGLVMQALTSTSDDEIAACLRALKTTHAGTGFMHESFDKDDPSKYSRSWFAWANTLFGELILTLYRERPHLLTTLL
jgi:meiotically up-regulated gene 157 (Mug157) protein